jgi:hypothetical protein
MTGYLNIVCIKAIAKKLTFKMIDTVYEHLLTLKGVHWLHSSSFDVIVDNLFQATNSLMDKKLLNEDTVIGIDSNKMEITLRSKISTRITRIRDLINAISVDNSQYTQDKHKTYFKDEKVSYDTINVLKGNINIKNVSRIAVVTVGDHVGSAVNTTVSTAVGVGEFGVGGFKKLVDFGSVSSGTKSDFNTGTHEKSSHGQFQSMSRTHSGKDCNDGHEKDELLNFTSLVSDAKKMFSGIGRKKNDTKSDIKTSSIKNIEKK